ncbi:MAG: hypothetical protein OXH15_06655 [Gammaproteobacteria bacterium]|nr:hypothetical protein [Gammaproteobacteria bacterium]
MTDSVDSSVPEADVFDATQPLDWDESPFDASVASDERFAIETRAESTRLIGAGDAARRGETNRVKAGEVGAFLDSVAGEEKALVRGPLVESVGDAAHLSATRLETTVHGRMSLTAGGAMGEDGIMMGGALTDIWTGGLMVGAAMSDDLVIGAGARITAPVDAWLNGLCGMEERPGTAAVDGVMVDIAGTLFEREYGAGLHAAGVAVWSGVVCLTQRLGFRPLMKTALGVRNLVPGGGGGGGEPAPPVPPAAPMAAGEGVLLVTGVGGSMARSGASVDNFQDVSRIAGAADEMENVAALRRAEDTASNLEDLTTVGRLDLPSPGRLDGAQPPSGMGAVDLPPASLPDGFESSKALGELDDLIEARMDRIEAFEGVATSPIDRVNAAIAGRLEELEELRRPAEGVDTLDTASDAGLLRMGETAGLQESIPFKPTGEIIDNPSALGIDDARRADLEAEMAKIRWPGQIAEGGEARMLQLEAEIDALVAVKAAEDMGEDPIEFLNQMGRQAEELYGAGDPRTVAYEDAAAYYKRINGIIDVLEEDIDLYMLASSEIRAGRDPRVALQNMLSAAQPGSDAHRQATEALSYLESNFQWAAVADDANPGAVSQLAGAEALPPGFAEDGANVLGDGGNALGDLEVDEAFRADAGRLAFEPLEASLGPPLMDDLRQVLDLDGVDMEALNPLGFDARQGDRLDELTALDEVLDLVTPQLDDAGAGWTGGAAALDESASASTVSLAGDYQAMQGAADVDAGAGVATASDDTRAVVTNMPLDALPEDFDWSQTMDALEKQYMDHRRASNWRGTIAYTDAIEGLRTDMYEAFLRFGGDADQLPNNFHEDIRRSLQTMLDQAVDAGDAEQVRLVGNYLESLDRQTYNAFVDLGERADEFAAVPTGAVQPLDDHVNQAKLADWMQSQRHDAARRMTEAADLGDDVAMTAAGQEMIYYQQMRLALTEGRNPLQESGDQIAYLRMSNPEQADLYTQFQDELIQVMSDPAYQKTAAEMGDATFAPSHFTRPDLREAPVSAGDGMDSQAFTSSLDGLDGQDEFSNGDYPGNRDVINDSVGDGDFARAPDEQPAGILKNPDADPGPINFDEGRIINQNPADDDERTLRVWVEQAQAESTDEALAHQGDIGNYMDLRASQRPYSDDDLMTANIYARKRLDGANEAWNPFMPGSAPGSEGVRSWDDAAANRKTVRFGDAEVVGVGYDAEDVLAVENQRATRRKRDAAEPWWSGSGINHSTEAINRDEAVRLPVAQGGDAVGREATRYPFRAREQIVLELMRGQRLDVDQIRLLEGTLGAAVPPIATVDDALAGNWIKDKQWRSMAELFVTLRDGVATPQTTDWDALARMLDMLDAAAVMA